MKYTPGEWIAEKSRVLATYVVLADNDYLVADSVSKRDANLIAASKDMYDALIAQERADEAEHDDDNYTYEQWGALCKKARELRKAVIAKTEGAT